LIEAAAWVASLKTMRSVYESKRDEFWRKQIAETRATPRGCGVCWTDYWARHPGMTLEFIPLMTAAFFKRQDRCSLSNHCHDAVVRSPV